MVAGRMEFRFFRGIAVVRRSCSKSVHACPFGVGFFAQSHGHERFVKKKKKRFLAHSVLFFLSPGIVCNSIVVPGVRTVFYSIIKMLRTFSHTFSPPLPISSVVPRRASATLLFLSVGIQS